MSKLYVTDTWINKDYAMQRSIIFEMLFSLRIEIAWVHSQPIPSQIKAHIYEKTSLVLISFDITCLW